MVESICWGCINAVPSNVRGVGCSWSRRLELVEGSEYVIRHSGGEDLVVMTACPLYRLDVGLVFGEVSGDEIVVIDEWLGLDESCEALGVSRNKVRSLVAAGRLRCVSGKYSPSDIEDLLDEFASEVGMIGRDEAGRILGVTGNRAYCLAKEGKIPYRVSVRDSRVLMRVEDVLAYKARRDGSE